MSQIGAIVPIERDAQGRVVMLDQTRLPAEEIYHVYDRAEQVGFIGTHHRKNTALMEYVARQADGGVTAGANFTHVDYHKHRHSDGVHFVSSGYDFAASEMAVTLVNACRKAEHIMALNGGIVPAVEERKKDR